MRAILCVVGGAGGVLGADTVVGMRGWNLKNASAAVMVAGLGFAAWDALGQTPRVVGAAVAMIAALVLVWRVSKSTRRLESFLSALVPSLVAAGFMTMWLYQASPDTPSSQNGADGIGETTAVASGTLPAPPVANLTDLHAQSLDIADQLTDGGSERVFRSQLKTDVNAGGSLIEVVEGDSVYRARLETYPEREWQWEQRTDALQRATFNGHDVTLDFATTMAQLREDAATIGINAAYESVWIDPGHSSFQPLESANPRKLPVLQFNSTVDGRELRPQILGDGTLPGTFFDITDQSAVVDEIIAALRLDNRPTSGIDVQTLTARTPTALEPRLDDRPVYGGVEFRGAVGAETLQVTVGVGQFPTVYSRTPTEGLGSVPLDSIPADSLDRFLPDTDQPVAWQLRAEPGETILRVIEALGVPEQRHRL